MFDTVDISVAAVGGAVGFKALGWVWRGLKFALRAIRTWRRIKRLGDEIASETGLEKGWECTTTRLSPSENTTQAVTSKWNKEWSSRR
jgi:hypothetical protein